MRAKRVGDVHHSFTFEHTYVSFVIFEGCSWLWGLPQAFIHLKQSSNLVLGLGKGKKETFSTLAGYLVSESHLP